MPPAGTSIGVSSATNTPEANSWLTAYQPLFSSTTIDHSLAEVAKTFHFREFGNGNANGGAHTGSENPPYADASMLTTSEDNIAYVMDDGLTSMAGGEFATVEITTGLYTINFGSGNYCYFTFIGTGFSVESGNWGETAFAHFQIVQNLPYGTHIMKVSRDGSHNVIWVCDGVTLITANLGDHKNVFEVTIYQPKMPPIPEDAVVIADYMLMADFVPVGAEGITVSKGIRRVSASRDLFYDCDQALLFNLDVSGISGFEVEAATDSGLAAGDLKVKLPVFGTQFVSRGYGNNQRDMFVNNSDVSQTDSSSASAHNTYNYPSAVTLGVNTFESRNTGTAGYGNIEGFEIASPIHTSSHYQTFETPFLHELVGGDRNMEQTNLVVTPDGKTWDEVTRDVSYLGKLVLCTTNDNAYTGTSDVNIHDEWRGTTDGRDNFNKNQFAIAYDRYICLKPGVYNITIHGYNGSEGHVITLFINTTEVSKAYQSFGSGTPVGSSAHNSVEINLKRGDYIQVKGESSGYENYNHLTVTKI